LFNDDDDSLALVGPIHEWTRGHCTTKYKL